MSVLRVTRKISKILSSHQKIRIVELIFLMVLGGILETLSVSLVIPFMDTVMKKWYVVWICNTFSLESPRTFLVFTALLLAIVYIFKNVYLLTEYNLQFKFVYGNMFSMQNRLLEAYIFKPYEFYLGANSGEILRVINEDTYNTFVLLTNLLNIFTEMIVSLMLIATVFFITPTVTLGIAVILSLLLLMINHFINRILRRVGKNNQEAIAAINKWLLQSTQGIKELKVMHSEEYFLENFKKYGKKHVYSLRISQILGLMPRFIIEAFSMSGMFFVVALLIYRGGSLEEMIPVISAVAMAAIRLMPSVNRISSALGGIAYTEPMLDKVIDIVRDAEQREKNVSIERRKNNRDNLKILSLKERIDFHNITFSYSGSSPNILTNTSFTIQRGELVGLVGESGAGKTTVADIILGLLCPQQGEVLVDGINIQNDLTTWYNQIGYIPQMIFMLDDTIRANVAFGISKEKISDQDVWRALENASMDQFVRLLPDGLDTEIGERGVRLSGGQRQRIGIARAIYRNPEVLIFDEATSALDNETEAIMESIHNLYGQKTIIIIAHRLTTIKNCDHVYRVEGGKIKKER